jgi:hypothetical protein
MVGGDVDAPPIHARSEDTQRGGPVPAPGRPP